MEEQYIGADERYRGRDLMNPQKHLLLEKCKEIMQQEQEELIYFLNRKDDNSQRYHRYEEELMHIMSTQVDTKKRERLEKQLAYIKTTQGDILKVIQPMYDKIFDQAAKEIPPGIEYNSDLKHDVWRDLIFGERDIPGPGDASKDTYRHEFARKNHEINRQAKMDKAVEQKKKNKDNIIPPRDHMLITKKNHANTAQMMVTSMKQALIRYMDVLGLNSADKQQTKNTLEKLFLYILVHTLIDRRLIFQTKSLKGEVVDETLQEIYKGFEKSIGEPIIISTTDIKRKLQNNTYDIQGSLDISYANAMIDDIEYREEYLNRYYLLPYGTNVDKLRIEIMTAYKNSQGSIEKGFELLNPMYHIYKQQEEQYANHIAILQDYQRKNTEFDPKLEEIIEIIMQEMAVAQKKKQDYVVIEDKLEKESSLPGIALGKLQKIYFKKYRIPRQYYQIFAVVMDKQRNFYKIKYNLTRKAKEKYERAFERYIHSDQQAKDFSRYINMLCTHRNIEQIFAEKWQLKRINRKQIIKNICLDPQKTSREKNLKDAKKNPSDSAEQLSLDL